MIFGALKRLSSVNITSSDSKKYVKSCPGKPMLVCLRCDSPSLDGVPAGCCSILNSFDEFDSSRGLGGATVISGDGERDAEADGGSVFVRIFSVDMMDNCSMGRRC